MPPRALDQNQSNPNCILIRKKTWDSRGIKNVLRQQSLLNVAKTPKIYDMSSICSFRDDNRVT